MATAVNEDQWRDSNARMEAEGYQWQRDVNRHGRKELRTEADPAAPKGFVFQRNGGMHTKRRLDLDESDTLVRFGARKRGPWITMGPADWLNSPWWLTLDRFLLLLDRARTAGLPLVEVARRQLAVPEEWSSMDVMVRARPKPGITLAAHAGPGHTVTVTGKGGAVTANFIVATEAPHLFMDQVYIPGLGGAPWLPRRPANIAENWLSFEGEYDPNARGFNPRP